MSRYEGYVAFGNIEVICQELNNSHICPIVSWWFGCRHLIYGEIRLHKGECERWFGHALDAIFLGLGTHFHKYLHTHTMPYRSLLLEKVYSTA